MFAFKASLVRFTLIELSRRGRLVLLSKITSLREINSTQKFLLLESLKVKKFAWVSFCWWYNWKQVCFKIQNVIVGKDVAKNRALNFTLFNRLNDKSSRQFIRLNGAECR